MKFRGVYACLSNMYPSPLKINGLYFSCAESAFQSFKTADPEIRKQFQFISGPEAKRLGRKLELRSDWNDIRLDVMKAVLEIKFKRYPEFMAALEKAKRSYGELVEDNTWGDTFWGRCNGKGENHLGKLLQEVLEGEVPF